MKIRIIEIIITAFIGMILNVTAFASPKSLSELGFKDDQIRDFFSVCFESRDLRCAILSRTINGKQETVTMIGERHDIAQSDHQLGSRLLKHYDSVGLEGTPYSTSWLSPVLLFSRIYGNERHSLLLKRDFKKMYNLERGTPMSKDIARVYALSASMVVGGVGLVSTLFQEGGMLDDTCPASGIPSNLGLLGTLVASKATLELVQAMLGDQDDKDVLDPIVLRARNLVMSKNLLAALAEGNQNMAAVMGIGHMFGVRKHLMEHGFEDQSEVIFNESLRAYPSGVDAFPNLRRLRLILVDHFNLYADN